MKTALVATALYALMTSNALADMPGSATIPCHEPLSVGGPGIERRSYPLEPYESCFAVAGAVCIVKDPGIDAHDPNNWSDLLIFYEPGAPWPTNFAIKVMYLSEQSTPGGVGGIQNEDLNAAFGSPGEFNIANILGSANSVYLPKNPDGPVTTYVATSYTLPMHYFITSNPGDPVPTSARTLGRLKAMYR